MKYRWFISNRLSLGGSNRTASGIAILGVGIATAVMLLTLAVTMGFKGSITSRLRGFQADVSVNGPYVYASAEQKAYFEADSDIINTVNSVFPGQSVAEVIRQPGILKTGDDYSALVFMALGKGNDLSFEKSNITEGEMVSATDSSSPAGISISEVTARRLGLSVGDRVDACFFVDGNIKLRRLTVSGLFKSDFGDYDRTVCYVAPQVLRDVAGVGASSVTSLELHNLCLDNVATKAQALQQAFVDRATLLGASSVPVVDNITNSGAMYLGWLDLLDTNVAVIFIIMCCVAAFTLVSSLFIIILNGIKTIGVLRTLGVDKRGIVGIFVRTAMKLVGFGILFGTVLALTFMWIQHAYNIIPLDPQMYYLSSVPVAFHWPGITAIVGGTALFGWLVLLLPARMATTISPASTMRYE